MATFCFVEPSVEAISGGLPNVAEIVESLVDSLDWFKFVSLEHSSQFILFSRT